MNHDCSYRNAKRFRCWLRLCLYSLQHNSMVDKYDKCLYNNSRNKQQQCTIINQHYMTKSNLVCSYYSVTYNLITQQCQHPITMNGYYYLLRASLLTYICMVCDTLGSNRQLITPRADPRRLTIASEWIFMYMSWIRNSDIL